MFFWILAFLKRRLIRRFVVDNVFFVLVTVCFLVGIFIKRFLFLVNVTIEGVVFDFFEFFRILGVFFFIIVIYEFVVFKFILII